MRRPHRKPRVLLVCPPWGRLDMPSLVGSTLAPFLRAKGFEASTRYLSLELGARLGGALYEEISESAQFLSDALFAAALPGVSDAPARFEPLARQMAKRAGAPDPDAFAARLVSLAREAAPIASAFAAGLRFEPCDFAVFLCERDVLNQSIPSAALARRLKALRPACAIAVAGAGFEGPVGAAYLDAFPWLDAALLGDLEVSLPAWLSGRREGVVVRGSGLVRAPVFAPLDALPVPEFDDYFAQRARLRKEGLFMPEVCLPFEGSRGCWWGEKSHCRFCNLNDETIAGRAKSPARLFDELCAQSRRHKVFRFYAKDNILPQAYVAELLPLLARLDLRIFYELKPRLDRDGVAALAAAGILEVQPGIETFSSALLKASAKGATAMQNVAFMKWCRHYGIELRYFLLHGFPGETAADYALVTEACRSLAHLQPPLLLRKLDLARHSPYFNLSDRHGFTRVRPMPEQKLAVPGSAIDWNRAANWFDHDLPASDALAAQAEQLSAAVARWKSLWDRPVKPSLEFRKGAGFLELYDGRDPSGLRRLERLAGAAAALYEACLDQPRTFDELARAAGTTRGAAAEAAARWRAASLAFVDGDSCLALALPFRRESKKYDMMSFYTPAARVETHRGGLA